VSLSLCPPPPPLSPLSLFRSLVRSLSLSLSDSAYRPGHGDAAGLDRLHGPAPTLVCACVRVCVRACACARTCAGSTVPACAPLVSVFVSVSLSVVVSHSIFVSNSVFASLCFCVPCRLTGPRYPRSATLPFRYLAWPQQHDNTTSLQQDSLIAATRFSYCNKILLLLQQRHVLDLRASAPWSAALPSCVRGRGGLGGVVSPPPPPPPGPRRPPRAPPGGARPRHSHALPCSTTLPAPQCSF
jgi:hypothetical protein